MMAKGHKSFRIDDLLCKKVNSEQKAAAVPAYNLTPSASPGSVASSPESTGMVIDMKNRSNVFSTSTSSRIQHFFENPHHKSHSLPPSPVSSTNGAIGAAGDRRHGAVQSAGISSNNDNAINMSKRAHENRNGQAGGGLSARRHSHQHHHRGHYQGNDFHGLAYRGPNSPYALERSTNESRGSSSSCSSRSGQTPTQTLTFYSPPSSTESAKPRARDDDALIIEMPSRGNQLPSAFTGLKQSLSSNGNNGRGGSARSSPSDGRSSTNSFQETRHERQHEQQRQRQVVSSSSSGGHGNGVSYGNHHQSQQNKMNTILAQQLSAGNPDAGMVYGGQPPNANMAAAAAAAAAAASAGLMPTLWPHPFLSLPLIDPVTGQPASGAMLARHHHHQQQQQQQQNLQPHQQSIAERAALLFSLNNRFHPYGLPFGNVRPTHSLLQAGSKRKGGQIRFSNSQTGQLEKSFIAQKYLNANDRKKLAHSLGLTDRQVKTWFQNRRAKWRKSKECVNFEAESHISGSSYNGRLDDSPDDGTCDSMVSMD